MHGQKNIFKKLLQGVSFIVAPISAGLSYRRLASALTFRDTCGAKDIDERQSKERESQRVSLSHGI
jgi:hypothetical protein